MSRKKVNDPNKIVISLNINQEYINKKKLKYQIK